MNSACLSSMFTTDPLKKEIFSRDYDSKDSTDRSASTSSFDSSEYKFYGKTDDILSKPSCKKSLTELLNALNDTIDRMMQVNDNYKPLCNDLTVQTKKETVSDAVLSDMIDVVSSTIWRLKNINHPKDSNSSLETECKEFQEPISEKQVDKNSTDFLRKSSNHHTKSNSPKDSDVQRNENSELFKFSDLIASNQQNHYTNYYKPENDRPCDIQSATSLKRSYKKDERNSKSPASSKQSEAFNYPEPERKSQLLWKHENTAAAKEAFFSYPPELIEIYSDRSNSVPIISKESFDSARKMTSRDSFSLKNNDDEPSRITIFQDKAFSPLYEQINHFGNGLWPKSSNMMNGMYFGNQSMPHEDVDLEPTLDSRNMSALSFLENNKDFIVPTRDVGKPKRNEQKLEANSFVASNLPDKNVSGEKTSKLFKKEKQVPKRRKTARVVESEGKAQNLENEAKSVSPREHKIKSVRLANDSATLTRHTRQLVSRREEKLPIWKPAGTAKVFSTSSATSLNQKRFSQFSSRREKESMQIKKPRMQERSKVSANKELETCSTTGIAKNERAFSKRSDTSLRKSRSRSRQRPGAPKIPLRRNFQVSERRQQKVTRQDVIQRLEIVKRTKQQRRDRIDDALIGEIGSKQYGQQDKIDDALIGEITPNGQQYEASEIELKQYEQEKINGIEENQYQQNEINESSMNIIEGKQYQQQDTTNESLINELNTSQKEYRNWQETSKILKEDLTRNEIENKIRSKKETAVKNESESKNGNKFSQNSKLNIQSDLMSASCFTELTSNSEKTSERCSSNQTTLDSLTNSLNNDSSEKDTIIEITQMDQNVNPEDLNQRDSETLLLTVKSQKSKRRFVNKHTVPLKILKSFLRCQGVDVDLINRAERELKGKRHTDRKSAGKSVTFSNRTETCPSSDKITNSESTVSDDRSKPADQMTEPNKTLTRHDVTKQLNSSIATVKNANSVSEVNTVQNVEVSCNTSDLSTMRDTSTEIVIADSFPSKVLRTTDTQTQISFLSVQENFCENCGKLRIRNSTNGTSVTEMLSSIDDKWTETANTSTKSIITNTENFQMKKSIRKSRSTDDIAQLNRLRYTTETKFVKERNHFVEQDTIKIDKSCQVSLINSNHADKKSDKICRENIGVKSFVCSSYNEKCSENNKWSNHETKVFSDKAEDCVKSFKTMTEINCDSSSVTSVCSTVSSGYFSHFKRNSENVRDERDSSRAKDISNEIMTAFRKTLERARNLYAAMAIYRENLAAKLDRANPRRVSRKTILTDAESISDRDSNSDKRSNRTKCKNIGKYARVQNKQQVNKLNCDSDDECHVIMNNYGYLDSNHSSNDSIRSSLCESKLGSQEYSSNSVELFKYKKTSSKSINRNLDIPTYKFESNVKLIKNEVCTEPTVCKSSDSIHLKVKSLIQLLLCHTENKLTTSDAKCNTEEITRDDKTLESLHFDKSLVGKETQNCESAGVPILSRENVLSFVYGVLCFTVFSCLQFSITCESETSFDESLNFS